MNDKLITVFTPTYNRAYIISELYESLLRQSDHDFEWLVIDDGSTDGTRLLIETFQQEKKIQIHYEYCVNGGKQRAINKGIEIAKGELFFIVDSDDYLTPDALGSIRAGWGKVKEKKEYAGLCFRKLQAKNLQILGKPFPTSEFEANSLELTYNYQIRADKAEVFRTEILKRFPFPEIERENFIPEALIWNRIATAHLRFRCIEKGIYVCDYLADGLSMNFNLNLKKNCKGFALYYRELLMYPHLSWYPDKLKAFIRLWQCKIYQLIR